MGITPKHKETASSSSNLEEPLAFDLPASGQLLQDGLTIIGLEQVAPLVRSRSMEQKTSILVRVSPGARAGLATKVMDQAAWRSQGCKAKYKHCSMKETGELD